MFNPAGLLKSVRQRFNHRVVDEIARRNPLDGIHQCVDSFVERADGIFDRADPLEDMLFHDRHPDLARRGPRGHQKFRPALPAELTIERISCRAVLAMDHKVIASHVYGQGRSQSVPVESLTGFPAQLTRVHHFSQQRTGTIFGIAQPFLENLQDA